MSGFTHSGRAWRIKASPTGRPDKLDQQEHTERRGSLSGLHEGRESKSCGSKYHPFSPPLPPHRYTHTHTDRELEQRCTWSTACIVEVGTAYTSACFQTRASSQLLPRLISFPVACAVPWLPRLQEEAGQLTLSPGLILHTPFSPDDH